MFKPFQNQKSNEIQVNFSHFLEKRNSQDEFHNKQGKN